MYILYLISNTGTELISSTTTIGSVVGGVAYPLTTSVAGEFNNLRLGDIVTTNNALGTTATIGQVLSIQDGQNITIANDYQTVSGSLYRVPTLTINSSLSIEANSTLHIGNTTGTSATIILFAMYLPFTATGSISGTVFFEGNGSLSRLIAVASGSLVFQSGGGFNFSSNPGAVSAASWMDGPVFGTSLGSGMAGGTPQFSFNTNGASVVFTSGSSYTCGATSTSSNVRRYTPLRRSIAATSPLSYSPVVTF
jgi:hypothetical protein